MNRRKLRIAVIVGLFLLATGCGVHGVKPVAHPDLKAVTYVTGVSFPESSRLLHYEERCDSFGREALVEVEIDARRSGEFISALGKSVVSSSRTDKLSITNVAMQMKRPDWWDPDSARKFIALQTSSGSKLTSADVSGGVGCQMLVKMDDSKRHVVYIHASTDE
jgi:hypothetical protein